MKNMTNMMSFDSTSFEKLEKKLRWRHGIAGFHCRCCNLWRKDPRFAKPLDRRYVRRKLKQVLNNSF